MPRRWPRVPFSAAPLREGPRRGAATRGRPGTRRVAGRAPRGAATSRISDRGPRPARLRRGAGRGGRWPRGPLVHRRRPRSEADGGTTPVEVEVERLLRTRIGARYPDDAVLGKESELRPAPRAGAGCSTRSTARACSPTGCRPSTCCWRSRTPTARGRGGRLPDERRAALRRTGAGLLARPGRAAGPAGPGQRPRAAARRPGRDAQPAGVVRGAAAHPAPRAVPAAVDQGRRRPGHRAGRRAGDRRRSPWPTRTSPSCRCSSARPAGGSPTCPGATSCAATARCWRRNGRLHDALLDLVAGLPHGRDFAALRREP